tara:strand:+ start:119 stop:535 length:417 start_codon:yes stop_codon:yes gene_type:complete
MSVDNTPHLKIEAPMIADAFVETPMSLTVGVEAANVIAVVVKAFPAAAQYLAELRSTVMIPELVGVFTMAETGAGSEVSTTAKPALLFATDAAGSATLSVTDVAGGSGLTTFLHVSPAPNQAGIAGNGTPAVATLTFD